MELSARMATYCPNLSIKRASESILQHYRSNRPHYIINTRPYKINDRLDVSSPAENEKQLNEWYTVNADSEMTAEAC